MPAKRAFPATENAKDEFLAAFSTVLPTHATTVGVSPAETTAVSNAALLYHWTLTTHQLYSDHAQEWTAFKNRLSVGSVTAPIVPPETPVPAAPPALPATGYGIFKWIGLLIQRIKKSPGYTPEIGRALGILNFEAVFAPEAGKPTLALSFVNSNQVRVAWKKGKYQGVEIEVDRGTGFIFLATDSVPDYIDTLAAPAAPAIWKYRAIYRLKDGRVGQWSNVARITVGG